MVFILLFFFCFTDTTGGSPELRYVLRLTDRLMLMAWLRGLLWSARRLFLINKPIYGPPNSGYKRTNRRFFPIISVLTLSHRCLQNEPRQSDFY